MRISDWSSDVCSSDLLIAHEFAVVFAHSAGGRGIARIGVVGAAGPFPGIAIQLRRAACGRVLRRCTGTQVAVVEQVAGGLLLAGAGGVFPFGFARQDRKSTRLNSSQ